MRLILATALAGVATAAAFTAPAAAQTLDVPSGTYAIDPTHASVVWKVSHFGFSVYTGMIERAGIDATIELDAADVAQSSVSATVGGTGVATLHPIEIDPRGTDFDAEIESEKFLNTAAFPDITFASTEIEVTGEATANITGTLTINEQAHPVVLETTLNKAADHPFASAAALGISATGTFDRTAFGINALAGPVGTEVTLEIEAEFVHQQ